MFQNIGPIYLAADVATGGTFTASYPAGTNKGSFNAGTQHKLIALQSSFQAPRDFTVAFGASVITVTYNGATTIPAGTSVRLQADMGGDDNGTLPAILPNTGLLTNLALGTSVASVMLVELGAPVAGGAATVSASQSVSLGVAALLNGSIVAAGGRTTFDVPRNVVGAWTGTAVVTVTGLDIYGQTVVESSASGTTLTGKKAFKSVSSIVPSANITSATFGTGNVLGLPIYLENAAYILKELEDDAAATAGTTVAGLAPATKSTATTADIRGTYVPNSTPDASKAFSLIVVSNDPTFLGNPQFAG